MGMWLILRRIEKLPPLSLERATGILLFFLWLLATDAFHCARSRWRDRLRWMAWAADMLAVSLQRILFNSFGTGGAVVALLAWLLITVTMIFDISVEDLFRWVHAARCKSSRLACNTDQQNGAINCTECKRKLPPTDLHL